MKARQPVHRPNPALNTKRARAREAEARRDPRPECDSCGQPRPAWGCRLCPT